MNDSKACASCGQIKTLEQFKLTKTKRASSKCLECYRLARAGWDKKYRSVNAAEIAAKKSEYVKANPELKRLQKQRFEAANPGKANDYKRAYNRRNPVQRAISKHRSRALAMGVEVFEVSAKEIRRIFNTPCVYCGAVGNISLDHALPLIKGGRHSIGNLLPACLSCNFGKRDLLVIQWRYELLKKAIRTEILFPELWSKMVKNDFAPTSATSPRELAQHPIDFAPNFSPLKGRSGEVRLAVKND